MKKLMLGLMMAFAVTAEADWIDGIDYFFNFDGTATIMGYDLVNPPTKVDVAEVEDGWGEKYIVTSVRMNAFAGCGLTSISLPNATTIGVDAFKQCGSLTSVSLPSATTIGDQAFDTCDSLTSVSLPLATTIGLVAFRDCENLKEVSLPSVTTIAGNAFSGCQGLSSLLVNAEMKKEIEDKGKEAYDIPQAATITYYDGLPYSVVEAAVYQMTVISGDKAIDEAEYKRSCDLLHLTPKEKPQVVKEGEIAVTKESIQAAKAETISIANNEIQLGVSVMSNSNITAEIAEWGKVNLASENVKVENGNVVITIPVSSASGFMILQSGDAKVGAGKAD